MKHIDLRERVLQT
uniref:Uncharacterized protein n=1 Tax=Lepeophtheirus salmonis TaxID=72036 RepID=A0A0K2UWB0_LEPSM